jgi:proteasome assembly chaperone (PAC2) family protein
LLIICFDGWGNALDVSRAMASYLIRNLKANPFARINPELFYRYDESRPFVKVDKGRLQNISPPGGSFYSFETGPDEKHIAILKASEPSLRWFQFVHEVLALCSKMCIEKIINVGSMYDDVLHSDLIISGLASTEDLLSTMKQKNIVPITYSGPGGIHSTLHSEAQKRGFECLSLWCHCPYYLQGATHFGLLSQLGSLLSSFGGFELDVTELDMSWKDMEKQIKTLIEENPELQAMVNGLRKAKVLGSRINMKDSRTKNGKIIQLKDFLEPK